MEHQTSSGERKILLAGHTSSQKHLGCQATSFALKQMLQGISPSIHTEEYNARRPDKAQNFISKKISRLTQLFTISPYMRGKQMKSSPEFAHYRDADLVVLNGEGMFYPQVWHRRDSACRQRLLEIYLAKNLLSKPTWVVNHSLFSNDRAFDDWIIQLYSTLDYIAVRDEDTLNYLTRLGIKNVELAADAVFSLTPPSTVDPAWTNKVFITDSSAWPIRKISSQHEPAKILVEQLKSKNFDVGYLSIRTDRRDEHIAQYFGLEYYACDTFQEMMSKLQSASFIVSGRFHVNVFATLCATPFISFGANTSKNDAFNRMIKHPFAAIDFQKQNADEVLALFEKAYRDRDGIKQHLSAQVPRMRELSLKNVPR